MTALTSEDLYGSYLYVDSKKVVCDVQRLLDITSVASATTALVVPERWHRILELEGLGKEVWEGVEPKQYVNELRDEWNSR